MIPENLGRLERVDLREVWRNEADDFTPWLAMQKESSTISVIHSVCR